MNDASRETLRQFLVLDYDTLKTILARRLGSKEQADEALQDAWVRLESFAPREPVKQPRAYILRMARNIALKRVLAERKTVTLDEALLALDIADDSPDPERIAVARSEAKLLDEVLAELTPRRRAILLASRVEQIPIREIAAALEVSQRMVERELRAALIHCGRRLGKNVVQRFGPRNPQD